MKLSFIYVCFKLIDGMEFATDLWEECGIDMTGAELADRLYELLDEVF